MKKVLALLGMLSLGILIGGYLFRDVQSRSVLALDRCQASCYQPNDLAGLLVAAGIARFGNELPNVILETDKTIAIMSPIRSQLSFHAIILPKKDIKNPGELSTDDRAYLDDAYAVMDQLIRDHHLRTYRIVTNGPGYQSVTYLHFHLEAR